MDIWGIYSVASFSGTETDLWTIEHLQHQGNIIESSSLLIIQGSLTGPLPWVSWSKWEFIIIKYPFLMAKNGLYLFPVWVYVLKPIFTCVWIWSQFWSSPSSVQELVPEGILIFSQLVLVFIFFCVAVGTYVDHLTVIDLSIIFCSHRNVYMLWFG